MLWSPKKTFPCRHLDHSSSRTKQSPTTKQALRSAKLLWNLPVASLTNEAYSHAFSFLAAISRHNVQRTLKFVFGCSKHQRLPVKVSKKVPICLLTSTLWWTRKYCCLGFEPGVWTVRNLWEGCISHHFAWHLSNLTSESASGTLILQAREMESPHCVLSHAQPGQACCSERLFIHLCTTKRCKNQECLISG